MILSFRVDRSVSRCRQGGQVVLEARCPGCGMAIRIQEKLLAAEVAALDAMRSSASATSFFRSKPAS